MKRWIKNGVFASDTIELNGCVVCNPTEDMLRQAGYKEYVEPTLTEKEKLERAKADKIAEIAAYDTSDKVNGFILNGQIVWLDKATRVGLMNSTTIERDFVPAKEKGIYGLYDKVNNKFWRSSSGVDFLGKDK